MSNTRRPVVITAPFATPDDVAWSYGIPKRRANELRKMVEASLAKKGYLVFHEKSKNSTSSKNGANNHASRSPRLKVRATSRIKNESGHASRRKPTRAKAKSSR